jgi:hypothetical protein
MKKSCFLQVRTELLTITYTSFGFKRLYQTLRSYYVNKKVVSFSHGDIPADLLPPSVAMQSSPSQTPTSKTQHHRGNIPSELPASRGFPHFLISSRSWVQARGNSVGERLQFTGLDGCQTPLPETPRVPESRGSSPPLSSDRNNTHQVAGISRQLD